MCCAECAEFITGDCAPRFALVFCVGTRIQDLPPDPTNPGTPSPPAGISDLAPTASKDGRKRRSAGVTLIAGSRLPKSQPPQNARQHTPLKTAWHPARPARQRRLHDRASEDRFAATRLPAGWIKTHVVLRRPGQSHRPQDYNASFSRRMSFDTSLRVPLSVTSPRLSTKK